MNPNYWYWRFQNNPAGKHMIKLMWEEEMLIGHYAVSPVFLILNGEANLSSLSMTTMTHPDYGGKGIFGLLANALYDELEANAGVKAIWGFPNNNSHYGFIKNLKWRDLGIISHMIKDAQSIKPTLSYNITNSENFTTMHSDLMVNITNDFKVSVKRNSEYMKWRYIENPNVHYDLFNYGKVISSFMIVKKYPNKKEGVNDLFIVECGIPVSEISILPEFLSHIVAYYNCPIETINIWLPLFDKRYISFEKNGFFVGGKPTYLGVRAGKDHIETLNDFRNWYYSYGDSDIY